MHASSDNSQVFDAEYASSTGKRKTARNQRNI